MRHGTFEMLELIRTIKFLCNLIFSVDTIKTNLEIQLIQLKD